jgi:hypothetical protein
LQVSFWGRKTLAKRILRQKVFLPQFSYLRQPVLIICLVWRAKVFVPSISHPIPFGGRWGISKDRIQVGKHAVHEQSKCIGNVSKAVSVEVHIVGIAYGIQIEKDKHSHGSVFFFRSLTTKTISCIMKPTQKEMR